MTAKAGTRPASEKITQSDKSLSACVEEALNIYFDNLKGHEPADVYEMVLAEVERPMLAVVLQRVGGNQSKAAQILGMSRGTLRKKLRLYGLS